MHSSGKVQQIDELTKLTLTIYPKKQNDIHQANNNKTLVPKYWELAMNPQQTNRDLPHVKI